MLSRTRVGLLALVLVIILSPDPAHAQDEAALVYNDDNSAPIIVSSLVEGGRPAGAVEWRQGGGILTEQPLFTNPLGPDGTTGTPDDDLRLQSGSPAIDAGTMSEIAVDFLDYDGNGTTTSEPLPIDLAYNRRMADGGSGQAALDLGAYEYGAPTLTVVGVEAPAPQPAQEVLTTPHPNPFTTRTTFQFSVQEKGYVQVKLHDALGRTVRVLYEGTPVPGQRYTVELDGSRLPSGMYFVRLAGENVQATQAVVLVK